MKGLKIVVLAKQVPIPEMWKRCYEKQNATVNRAALPAIFNPEQALRIKDKN